jgi:hypothetical protein
MGPHKGFNMEFRPKYTQTELEHKNDDQQMLGSPPPRLAALVKTTVDKGAPWGLAHGLAVDKKIL